MVNDLQNELYKGAFTYYVDKILSIYDRNIFFTLIGENLNIVEIFITTYLPRLVDVVCECPLSSQSGF